MQRKALVIKPHKILMLTAYVICALMSNSDIAEEILMSFVFYFHFAEP